MGKSFADATSKCVGKSSTDGLLPRCLPTQKNVYRGFAHAFLTICRHFFALAETKILIEIKMIFDLLVPNRELSLGLWTKGPKFIGKKKKKKIYFYYSS